MNISESFLPVIVALAMAVTSVIDISGILHLRLLCIYSENLLLHRNRERANGKGLCNQHCHQFPSCQLFHVYHASQRYTFYKIWK